MTMVLSFSILIVSIIVVALTVAYRFTITELRYTSTDYISQLISQVNADIDQYVGYMEDVADVVGNDFKIRQWIAQPKDLSDSQMVDLESGIRTQMQTVYDARKDIANIAVFSDEHHVIFDSRYKRLNTFAEHEQSVWYTEAIKNNGVAAISSSHVQNVVQGEYRWVVSLSKAIFDIDKKPQGVLLVDLNYRLINDLCKSIDMGKRGYIFLVDKQGNIIFHPKQQEIFARLKSENVDQFVGKSTEITIDTPEGTKIYTSNHSEVTGWTVVGVAYLDEVLSNRENIVGFYVTIGITFLLVALLLSVAISTAITGPVKRLEGVMQQVRDGRLDVRSNIHARNEVGRLGESFNLMISQLNQLIKQRESDQEQRRQSELKALQAQINPHFLYNTLDSIIWMAENGNNEEVVEMTAALARLFRSSISENRDTVPLFIEVANIQSYLTIQKMRYQEKLNYSIDIPQNLRDCRVPKLMLQPLVENAIYHGVRNKEKGGKIDVTAMEENGKLVLRVSDDGIGMTQSQLNHVFDAEANARSSGIGVKNVSERIKLVFGSEYSLNFNSEAGKGTVVTAILPLDGEVADK